MRCASAYSLRGSTRGVPARSPTRRATTDRLDDRQRAISRAISRHSSHGKSTGRINTAALYRARNKPALTDAESPWERRELTATSTRSPRSSARARTALGGRTTMTRVAAEARRAGLPEAWAYAIMREESAFDARVVSPAKAFGLPSRAEKPADRTTRRTPATAFVGIISP